MSPRRIKTLTWFAAFLVGGGLVFTVADFLRRRAVLEQPVPKDELERVVKGVEGPEPPKDDRVEVKALNRVFHAMNWTGKEEVKTEGPGPTAPPVKTVLAMANLLHVLVLQIDTNDAKAGIAYVSFTPESKLQRPDLDPEERILRVGERLPTPHEDVLVDAITTEGVRFVFDDTTRAPEVVPPVEPPIGRMAIVVVDHALMPEKGTLIPRNANPRPYNPKTTTQTGRNEYQLGSESVKRVEDDYPRILAEDIGYKEARDPKTGALKGLLVTRVAPDSIAAEHGVTEGEIVKSINGHPVTSVSDAVSFVKRESSTTNTWLVEFEKQGRTFTRTYRSPPQE